MASYIWYSIIGISLILFIYNIISLIGILIFSLPLFKFGKSIYVNLISYKSYEELIASFRRIDAVINSSYRKRGVILLREKFSLFSFNVIIKLRTIITNDNEENSAKKALIFYDKWSIYFFFFFFNILLYPLINVVFGDLFSFIFLLITLLIYHLISKKLMDIVLKKYNKIIELSLKYPSNHPTLRKHDIMEYKSTEKEYFGGI